jgi:LPS sulfotransferase NodH
MPKFLQYHLRSRVTPFVVLFIERDGSTYLTSLLASHPEVRVVYERFAVLRQQGASPQAQLAWADAFFSPPLIGRAAAIGFKTKLVDVLDPNGFARLLRARACRILLMRRQNHVKAVVSRINARRLHDVTGNWNLYDSSDRMPPMVVDPGEFDRFLKERAAAERELEDYVARLGLPTLRLDYEEMLVDRETALARVFGFLQVRPVALEGRTLKHTPDDLRRVVLNFDDLVHRYTGTAYEPMFREVIQDPV